MFFVATDCSALKILELKIIPTTHIQGCIQTWICWATSWTTMTSSLAKNTVVQFGDQANKPT